MVGTRTAPSDAVGPAKSVYCIALLLPGMHQLQMPSNCL